VVCSSKKQVVRFRESGVDGDDVQDALDASSHVKASEPTFLERDLQPNGSCRAEPQRAFSTFEGRLNRVYREQKFHLETSLTFA